VPEANQRSQADHQKFKIALQKWAQWTPAYVEVEAVQGEIEIGQGEIGSGAGIQPKQEEVSEPLRLEVHLHQLPRPKPPQAG